jgi:hypothetical protein
MEALLREDEPERLEAMQRYRILDTPPNAYAVFSITFAQAARTC